MTAAPDRFLLIKAKGGFGNRILSAATGVVIARLTGRTAVVDWRDGEYLPHGEDAYPLLFESPTPHRAADFDARSDVTPALWRGRLSEHPTHLISDLFPNDHSNPFIYRKLSIDLAHPDVREPLAVFWSYLPKMARIRRAAAKVSPFRGMSRDALTRWALREYFRPNARVRAEVDALFADRARPIIGVHIRYTDRKVSLDRIMQEVQRVQARVPSAQIFLATDNEGVQEQFRARFRDVFVIDKVLGDDDNSLHEHVELDDPLREAENALIDMWALASCDWLVHSRHSTFSVAAALIGGIPTSRQRDIDRRNVRVVLKRWVQTWA
ncbi:MULTISPECIES: nodulation protein NodZ [Microbacterium]|uniref:Nodulation protein Z (NodZ) n=1 Tax=Microbacterium saccharophilum TaxID=1213358 RepID=A0A7Z7CZ17_9MICO|nr:MULTISPECIES: nodulation protein NodZ [Microbacterium]SFI67866.1 Nodulation protein Z (NodZ) [Microbacterium saccharophilum]